MSMPQRGGRSTYQGKGEFGAGAGAGTGALRSLAHTWVTQSSESSHMLMGCQNTIGARVHEMVYTVDDGLGKDIAFQVEL